MNFLYIWLLFEQIANNIGYLHNNDLVHGDICPENIIVIETTNETYYNYNKCQNKYLYSKLIGISSINKLKNFSKHVDPNETNDTDIITKRKVQPIVEGICGNLL